MTRILSIVNQKGGVGKTTTATNLATALAAINKRVLLIDLDPQGNASTGLGIELDSRARTIYDVLVDDLPLTDAIYNTPIPRLDIITSTVDLSAAEIELITALNREYILKNKLASAIDNYDFVIIDCPPSLGLLTINALTSSNSILIPLQCEFYALEGLSHLIKTTRMVQDNLNPSLRINGVVLTMYDKRNKLTEQVESDVRGCLGDTVCTTVIPRNVKISEAPSHGKPALLYDLKCAGSLAYVQLAREILDREELLIDA